MDFSSICLVEVMSIKMQVTIEDNEDKDKEVVAPIKNHPTRLEIESFLTQSSYDLT